MAGGGIRGTSVASGTPAKRARDVPSSGARAGAPALSRRSLLSTSLLGGAAAALAACSRPSGTTSSPQMPAGDDLVVGASLELTGTGAVVGVAQRKAVTIAQDKINSTGVVVAGALRRVRVTIRDNASDPKQAAAIAEDFTRDPQLLAIIGGGIASTAKAMAPIAEQQKTPLLATACADSILRPIANRRFVFKLGPNASDVASLLTGAIREQGLTRIAIVAEAGDHGDSGVAAVTTAANNDGRKLAVTVRVPIGSRDYRDQAEQVAAEHPDAVVIWAVAPTPGLVARALRAAGYAGRMFFDTGAASEDALNSLNRAATVDSYLVAPTIMGGRPVAVTTPAELDQVDFFEQYTQLYGAFSGVAVPAADALNLVIGAAQRGRTAATRLRIRDELEAAPYDGLAGQYIFSTISHGGVEPDSLSLFQTRRADWVRVD
jgi:branched-chain amino acid transport system substrate-binding protein